MKKKIAIISLSVLIFGLWLFCVINTNIRNRKADFENLFHARTRSL